jgi:hypothetical protein
MKNYRLAIVGVIALASAVTLNLRHALNDYGIKSGKLHTKVWAASSSGNTSSGDTSGDNFSSVWNSKYTEFSWFDTPPDITTTVDNDSIKCEKTTHQHHRTCSRGGTTVSCITAHWKESVTICAPKPK